MNRLRAALPLIVLVLAGIALFSSGLLDRLHPEQLVSHEEQLHAGIAAHPWLSRLAFIGLLTASMATGIPGVVVVIMAGGFAFGVLQGTIYASIGVTLGSLILYLASRHAFGSGNKQRPVLVDKLHAGFERHPVGYTLFVRAIPVAPFGLISVALAWLRCPLGLFVGASWLGGTVSAIFETSVGAGLGEALKGSNGHLSMHALMTPAIWTPVGAIVLLALLPVLLKHAMALRQRHTRKQP